MSTFEQMATASRNSCRSGPHASPWGVFASDDACFCTMRNRTIERTKEQVQFGNAILDRCHRVVHERKQRACGKHQASTDYAYSSFHVYCHACSHLITHEVIFQSSTKFTCTSTIPLDLRRPRRPYLGLSFYVVPHLLYHPHVPYHPFKIP